MRDRSPALRQARGLALFLVLLLAAVACGGGEPDSDGGEAIETSQDDDDTADAEEPADDGETPGEDGEEAPAEDSDAEGDATFVYAMAGVPDTLDHIPTYQGDSTRRMMYELGSTLTRYAQEEAGCDTLQSVEEIEGDLAESWERDDEGNLVFTLREGVVSADGNPMTAADVVWSLERARELSPIVNFLMSDVADFVDEGVWIEEVDDMTVKVIVNVPTALDHAVFTWGQMVIFDRTAVEANVDIADTAAVTDFLNTNLPTFGPWVLDRFEPGTEVAFTPHPEYWGAESRGNVSELVLRNVSEASTRLQLVETGEADLAGQLSFEQYESLQGGGEDGAQVLACASPNRDMILLNTGQNAFGDVDVRRAISMAIDRETLAQSAYRGFAEPTTTGLSQVAYEFPDPANQFEFDPEQAQQLLADAGAEGLQMSLRASPTRPGAHAEAVAIQVQSMLQQIGVQTEIDLIAGAAEFSDAFFAGEYEAILYNEPPAIGDPFYSLNLYNTTASFQNTFGFANDRYDEVAAEIQQTEPGEERQALMQEASEIIIEEVPSVYLVERQYVYAWSDQVDVDSYRHAPHGEIRVVNLQVQPD